ncbi:MAG: endonuclease domain-containing protein [Cyanobacteria bacterium P01_A01_bin.114]
MLKDRQLDGLKFRVQHPVGRFIIDFYCPVCRLLVEVDGAVHQTQADYDSARTEQLEAYGYKILRFTNDEVINNLSSVLMTIQQTASRLMA